MRLPMLLQETVARLLEDAQDPFGFNQLLDGLVLDHTDFPALARERRLEGICA